MKTNKLAQLMAGFAVLTLVLSSQLGVTYAEPYENMGSEQVIVNINTADSEELQKVRGIGPSLAERILEYRELNGPFQSAEDLAHVRGIGGAKLQKIKTQIIL